MGNPFYGADGRYRPQKASCFGWLFFLAFIGGIGFLVSQLVR
jgi:hypothetical protein